MPLVHTTDGLEPGSPVLCLPCVDTTMTPICFLILPFQQSAQWIWARSMQGELTTNYLGRVPYVLVLNIYRPI